MGIIYKNKIFECKKELELSEWDVNNDCFSAEIMAIEKGSVWECYGKGYICGGEVRLEEVDSNKWIEISKETLKEYFSDITKSNNEMAENEYLRYGY